jgi:hypothetical protein
MLNERRGQLIIDDDVNAIALRLEVRRRLMVLLVGDVRVVDEAGQEWCVLIKLWMECKGQRR